MSGAITDWGQAMLASLVSVLTLVLSFIPKFLGFLVILLIGWLVASALAKAVTFLLRRIGFEQLSARIGLTRFEQRLGMRMDAASVLGKIVYWFVFLIFLVPAVDALGLTTISTLLAQIIYYLPNVFVAVLVLFLGMLVARFAGDAMRNVIASKNPANASLMANITRTVIIGFAVLVALQQLSIAPALITILFAAIVGGAALAAALAFGLGGREAAQRWLAHGESAIRAPQAFSASQTPQALFDPEHMSAQQQMVRPASPVSGIPGGMATPSTGQPAYSMPPASTPSTTPAPIVPPSDPRTLKGDKNQPKQPPDRNRGPFGS